MKVYHGGPSPANMRKCRAAAPSHVHGACWTPNKTTPHEWPFFVDNGVYTGDFDPDEWLDTLDYALTTVPSDPDFFVLPDVFGDAEATIEKHREWLYKKPLPVRSGEVKRYWVVQPGLPVDEQFDAIEGCQGVFVGGPVRWKRAHGAEIVQRAHEQDLLAHIGNPGSADGLVWAYDVGFDSVDTSSILQNQYFHWLEQLETATRDDSPNTAADTTRQASLADVTAE